MISDRLLSISSLINDGESIIDIGCDHGLLDVYLTLNKGCKCSCCDVSSHIVDRAISNFRKHDLLGKINAFVGNGFSDLHLSDDTIMVMAGMGTSTILKILDNNRTHDIICQTNTDLYLLRKTICSMGYYIVSEDLVFDNNRYYVSIRFSIGESDYNYDDLLLGPILINKNDILFKKYVNDMHSKLMKGYKKSIEFNSDSSSDLSLMITCLKKYI